VFLKLAPTQMSLNGEALALEGLGMRLDALRAQRQGTPHQLLLSLSGAVTSQRLVDVLAVLRRQPDLAVTVVE
jgi:biopolymer transport protein ExbD